MNSNPKKLADFLVGRSFNVILALITIVSFCFYFIENTMAVVIALISFIFFLLIILFRIFWVIEKLLERRSPDGVHKISTSVKYFTRDGLQVVYELEKFIQCKQMLLQTHDHVFFWSGSKTPVISSDTMTYDSLEDSTNGYKKASFKLKSPVLFNNVFMAHIRMEIDDSDKKSSTHIEQHVKDEMQIVNFKVLLLHKKGSVPDARLLRRPIGSVVPFEHLKAIPFDKKTAAYECPVYQPEVGYAYRLEWAR